MFQDNFYSKLNSIYNFSQSLLGCFCGAMRHKNTRHSFSIFYNLRTKRFLTKTYNNSNGYTLIEVMLSVLFFSVIALGMSHTLTNSIVLTGHDQSIITANNLARLYLKDVQLGWRLQQDFDTGSLPDINSTYTSNGKYDVNVDYEDLATNSDGTVIIKRVTIDYTDSNGNILSNIYLDYNRPGSFVK